MKWFAPFAVKKIKIIKQIKTQNMKKTILMILFISTINLTAQNNENLKWYNQHSTEFPSISNQGWQIGLQSKYHRLPLKAKSQLREVVWDLSKNSAGLSLKFITNSKKINIKYEVKGDIAFPHMPATGVSGIDLYYKTKDNKFLKCWGNYSIDDSTKYSFFINNEFPDYNKNGAEYTLLLPLYNEIENLEIGLEKSAFLKPLPLSLSKPIVAYGTSICQGACASRPGMAWTNILERRLGIPVINLGFSGNGKLEQAIIKLMTEINAAVYILDCLPNLDSSKDDVFNLTVKAVKTLRQQHPKTPIILCSHIGYSNSEVDKWYKNKALSLNNDLEKAYDHLISEGFKDIYLIKKEDIKLSSCSYVDYIHPNDHGMIKYADVYEALIQKILH